MKMNSYKLKLFILIFSLSNLKITVQAAENNCTNNELLQHLGSNWNNSNYTKVDIKKLTVAQFFDLVVNETISEICAKNAPKIAMNNFLNYTNGYNHHKSIDFCDQIKNVTLQNEKVPDSVKILFNFLNEPMKCKIICTLNIDLELQPKCPVLLFIYKDANNEVNTHKSSKNIVISEDPKKLGTNAQLNNTPKDNGVPKVPSENISNKENETTNLETSKSLNANKEPQKKQNEEEPKIVNDKLTETDEPHLTEKHNMPISPNVNTFIEAEDSHFLIYFVVISILCIGFYLVVYNKKKILALMIEGRKRNVRRRPNSAAYSKLDCNLEEAMASGPSTSTSNTLLY